MFIPFEYLKSLKRQFKAKNMKTAKQKGKLLENYITDEIIKRGLDDRAVRDGASGAGNREKRDVNTSMMILDRTAGIEAKNHKVPHIKDWWLQTQKLEKLGYEPILVYKLFGESLGDSKAVIYLSTLLDLLANKNENNKNSGIPIKDKWIVKNAIEILKKLLKILEKYGYSQD